MRVVITGANGYIGSHVVARLAELGGYGIMSVSTTSTRNDDLVKKHSDLFIKDYNGGYNRFVGKGDILVHLGGYISVEESMRDPMKYYKGNTQATIDYIDKYKFDNMVFASTAACFDPVSHYAKSKLACEEVIKGCVDNYTIFRFFNVAGINPGHFYVNPTTHIISKIAECAVNKETFTFNGNDFDTCDGTCVRDYVDINDLVESIVLAINKPANTDYECLGTGNGFSNMAVFKTMEFAIQKHIDYDIGPRRPGDPAKLVVEERSDYFTQTRSLEDMCKSTYGYFKNLKNQ